MKGASAEKFENQEEEPKEELETEKEQEIEETPKLGFAKLGVNEELLERTAKGLDEEQVSVIEKKLLKWQDRKKEGSLRKGEENIEELMGEWKTIQERKRERERLKKGGMAWQIGKTMLSTVGSIAGVKSFYDVPEYFRERFNVRGMFGKGKGVEGSIEELLSASQQAREGFGEPEEKTEHNEPRPARIATQSVAGGPETRKAIEDLNKRLKLTKEGSQKGSEQRKLIAKLLMENRQKEKWSKEERSGEITKILDEYTTTKITGVQAAREALNSFFVASGAYGLRGISYGLMDGVERASRLKKEAKKQGEKARLFRDVIAGGIKDTFLGAFGKGKEKTKKEKALSVVKSWGRIVRYLGIAAMVEWHPETAGNAIDKAIDAFEGKVSFGDVAENFKGNIERLAGFYGGLIKKGLDWTGVSKVWTGEGEEGLGGEVITMPITKEGVIPEAPEAEMPPEAPAAEPFQIAENVSVKKGDSIWTVAEKYLRGNKTYEELSKVGDKDAAEALETYNIDRVKDTILAHPQNYGLPEDIDVDKLTVGQLKEINWEKAFSNTYPEGKGLTVGLPKENIENIVKNNETLRTFFQEHPDAPRTGENYEAIIKGSGMTEAGEEVSFEEAKKLEEITNLTRTYQAKGILLGRGLTLGETEVWLNKDPSLEKILSEIPKDENKAWEIWRGDETPDLPHHGMYSSREFGRQLDLAQWLREQNPTGAEMKMGIKEYLEKVEPTAGVNRVGVAEVLPSSGKIEGGLSKEGLPLDQEAAKSSLAEQINALREMKAETIAAENSGLTSSEYEAIKDVKVGKLLKEISSKDKAWEIWRGDKIPDLPHYGTYGSREFGRQIKLAEYLRKALPLIDKSPEAKGMAIKDILGTIIRPEGEAGKGVIHNIDLP